MKRFFSLLAAVMMCIIMLPLCELDSHAAENFAMGFDGDSSKSILADDRGIFSDHAQYFEELDALIKEYSENLQMNILVYVSGTIRTDKETEIFADDEYDEWFGEDTDGVYYYLDLSGKKPAFDYISTSGKAVLSYEDNIDDIFSVLDNYLPASGQSYTADDIYQAITAFLRCLEKYYDKNPGALKYYRDVSSGKNFYYKNGELIITTGKPPAILLRNGMISFFIGFITFLLCYFITKSNYKFKGSCKPQVYLSSERTHYYQNTDTFIKSYVTKHKIESSSSGGGSRSHGGGHSHSGGHGGGGHHR